MTRLNNRFELREVLGRGGMGVVYRAFDTTLNREVAIKTTLDAQSPAVLDLFYREWALLATVSHTNIVDILDKGEWNDDGQIKPFFVMPLLIGCTLDKLIAESSSRLTMERSVDILAQTCRGLQAAHERGLIHRDLKPSNIFVMNDDAVKIIDFGMAHAIDTRSTTTLKGTLLYMAPEQVERHNPTTLSDIFSFGVTAYETLSHRRPFQRGTEREICDAILHETPPPLYEINSAVNKALSQVVHKCLAKQPHHRFSSAREVADALQKALRNEPIEIFNPSRIQSRVSRARAAYESGEHGLTLEILRELEAEGYLDESATLLRQQVEGLLKQKTINQLLEMARLRFDQEEFPLALQRIQEVLQLDAENAEALALRQQIESQRADRQVQDWIQLAQRHLDNGAFAMARDALDNVLKLRPTDPEAIDLKSRVIMAERSQERAHKEKQSLYQQAMEAFQRGEISSALSRMESLMDLQRRIPDKATPDLENKYQTFYQQVSSDQDAIHQAYAEGSRNFREGNYDKTLAICHDFLEKYPGHALFQALRVEAEGRKRQEVSVFIAETDWKVEAEPNLDRKVAILKEAIARYPDEQHFAASYKIYKDKRDLVEGILARIASYEERGMYTEALNQIDVLRVIYAQHPGLDYEADRLRKKREQQAVEDAKAARIEEVDRLIEAGDWLRAGVHIEFALKEYPDDNQLIAQRRMVEQGRAQQFEAQAKFEEARQWLESGDRQTAIQRLRDAWQLSPGMAPVRGLLTDTLAQEAEAAFEKDPQAAENYVAEALSLNEEHARARTVRSMLQDRNRHQSIERTLASAREKQAAGDIAGALEEIAAALSSYPHDGRLLQLQTSLKRLQTELLPSRWMDTSVTPSAPAARVDSGAQPNQIPPKETASGGAPPRKTAGGASTGARRTSFLSGLFARWRRNAAADSTAEKPRRILPMWFQVSAAAAVIVFAAVTYRFSSERPQSATVPGSVSFRILTAPEGAQVSIDGLAKGQAPVSVDLSPGDHRIEATLPGYESKSAVVRVEPGMSPFAIDLAPLRQSLRLEANVTGASAALDNNQPVPIQDGQIVIPDLSPGPHTLRIDDPKRGSSTFAFDTSHGKISAVKSLQAAKDTSGVVITSFGQEAFVHSTAQPVQAKLGETSLGEVREDGLRVTGLSSGSLNQITLGSPPDAQVYGVDAGMAPSIAVFLRVASSSGNISVDTAGENDVQVYVNNFPTKRPTVQGRRFLPDLPPGNYTIRVAKPGFRSEPAEVQLKLEKGESKTARFRMVALPTVSSLHVENAPAGTQISVSGLSATAGPDGSMSLSNIPPGERDISITRARFKPKTLRKTFVAGEDVKLTSDDLRLQSSFGRVLVRVNPASAKIAYRRGAGPWVDITTPQLELEEGKYEFRASADNYNSSQQTVAVASGADARFEVSLTSVVTGAPPVEQPKDPLSIWSTPDHWTKVGDDYALKGSSTEFVRGNPASGRYRFSVPAPGRFALGWDTAWLAGYKDNRNYTRIEVGKSHVEWWTVTNGASGRKTRFNHGVQVRSTLDIDFQISPTSITLSVGSGGDLKALDNPIPIQPGRFGLVGKDGMRVAFEH